LSARNDSVADAASSNVIAAALFAAINSATDAASCIIDRRSEIRSITRNEAATRQTDAPHVTMVTAMSLALMDRPPKALLTWLSIKGIWVSDGARGSIRLLL